MSCVVGKLLSSRDLLHIKFENLNKCNGHVNATKINSKPKFPVTFTSFFLFSRKSWAEFKGLGLVLTRGPLPRFRGPFLIDSDKDLGEILKVFFYRAKKSAPGRFLLLQYLRAENLYRINS